MYMLCSTVAMVACRHLLCRLGLQARAPCRTMWEHATAHSMHCRWRVFRLGVRLDHLCLQQGAGVQMEAGLCRLRCTSRFCAVLRPRLWLGVRQLHCVGVCRPQGQCWVQRCLGLPCLLGVCGAVGAICLQMRAEDQLHRSPRKMSSCFAVDWGMWPHLVRRWCRTSAAGHMRGVGGPWRRPCLSSPKVTASGTPWLTLSCFRRVRWGDSCHALLCSWDLLSSHVCSVLGVANCTHMKG